MKPDADVHRTFVGGKNANTASGFTDKREVAGIFDGFPRTMPQAEALDAALASRGRKVDRVIRMKVDATALLARVPKRFEAEGRADDNPESFKKRLAAYNSQTAPLLPYYAGQGKLTEIDGMAGIDKVASAISRVLDQR
jgi:adenylate kinase